MMSGSDHLPKGLVLKRTDHPAFAGVQTLVFQDWRKAIRHLEDHVLTAPESLCWAIVMPEYESMLDPADGKARLRYARAAEQDQGVTAQPLYDLYADSIVRDMCDSRQLGWLKSRGDVTVTLGTCGILCVVAMCGATGSTVRTAFLPGQGDPEAVARSHGASEGVQRERTTEWPWPSRLESARERRARHRREAQAGLPEPLYYLVFRPAVQFIRTRYPSQHDMMGRPRKCDYAILKDVLPRASRLKLGDWQQYRARCGR